MKVVLTQPVEMALRTLSEEEQRKVSAWFDHLANWENDPVVRERSHPLPSTESAYVLRTNTDIRIFFELEQDRIVVRDLANKETIMNHEVRPSVGAWPVMKDFVDVLFDPAKCQSELTAFGKLLAAKSNLSERDDLLPFFKKRKQLSAFIGTYAPNIGPAPRLAYEFPFFGDFAADVVLGNREHGE
jgi:hypothetical protein